jgi:SCY1-like protein 1
LSSVKDEEAVIYVCNSITVGNVAIDEYQNYGTLVPDSDRYAAPEVAKAGWEVVRNNPIHAIDAYGFGILIYETFNGGFQGTDQLTQPKLVPADMQQSYKRLVSANPKVRISAGNFLEQGLRSGGFFETPLIQLTDGIENLGLKSEGERDDFLEYAIDNSIFFDIR